MRSNWALPVLLSTLVAVHGCGGGAGEGAATADVSGSSATAGTPIQIRRAQDSGDASDAGRMALAVTDGAGKASVVGSGELVVQLSLDPDFADPVEVDVAIRSSDAVTLDVPRPTLLGATSDDAPVHLRVRRVDDNALSNPVSMPAEKNNTTPGVPALVESLLDWLRSALNFGDYEWQLVKPNDRTSWAARAGLQAVELGDRLYLMGGRTPLPLPIPGASVIWGDVWASDDRGATWQPVLAQDTPGSWPARAYFQAVTKNGHMYLMGGQNFKIIANPGCAFLPPGVPCTLPDVPASDFFSDVWRSADGAHWTRMTANAGWAGRAGLSAAVFKNEIYVMGGSQNDDSAIIGGPPARVYFNDVWKSRDGATWERVTPKAPWAPRAGAVAAVKDGYLWILGGEDGFLCDPSRPDRCPPYYNDVWRSRDGKNWEQVTASAEWSKRPGHQCVVLLDRFVCFGGFGLPETGFEPNNPRDMWSSRNGRNWTKINDAPWNAESAADVKYDFDALVLAGGKGALRPSIFTFGGDRETFDFGDPQNFLRVDNDVWRFSPPSRPR